jgi:uncharacterized protein YyaL (SSP411 family)
MPGSVSENMKKYPSAFSNWGILAMNLANPFCTIVICGDQALELARQFDLHYLPNVMLAARKDESDLPIFQNRFIKGKTLIYVCDEDGCRLPVENVEAAMKLLDS